MGGCLRSTITFKKFIFNNMSRKYIKQYLDQNFVFPNNDIYEYDTEIIHDINNNSVSGTVTNLSATTISYSAITITFDWAWSKNGAEPFIDASGNLQLLSVHVLAAGQDYYKPWRLVDDIHTPNLTGTTFSGSNTTVITPSDLGLTTFVSGDYFIEFRFIGHRAIYPACGSLTLSIVAPTPTPTPGVTTTPTPTLTPTQTVTPTPGVTTTPTPTPTPDGSKSLELRVLDIASTPQTITMFYNVNSGSNINIPGGTSVTFPITCTLLYTISGLTTGDVITFGTSIDCAMEGAGGTSCPGFVSSMTTYAYVVDAPSVQTLSLTIDTQTIP
jgi:hypothetical protein